MRLASFNTHYGVKPTRRPPADEYDLEAALASFDADVIVVQELWRPDRRRGRVDLAAERLGYELLYEATGPASDDHRWPRITRNGTGESGIAVLSRLPVRRIGALVVGPTVGDPAPRRTALDVEVDLGRGESTGSERALRLIAVHLTSRLPYGPPFQMRRLARQLPPAGTPTAVVGDCNFWGPGVVSLLPGWQRAVRGRTWPAHAPHSQIDHVLVRPAEIAVHSAQVLGDVGSDHRPIVVELALR